MATPTVQAATVRAISHSLVEHPEPWVVGFSGGKDSSCVVKLVYQALLRAKRRNTSVTVLYCDTGVEVPAHPHVRLADADRARDRGMQRWYSSQVRCCRTASARSLLLQSHRARLRATDQQIPLVHRSTAHSTYSGIHQQATRWAQDYCVRNPKRGESGKRPNNRAASYFP
jgi:hypothetical protein